MINKTLCFNNSNIKGTGLDISVSGMTITISAGTMQLVSKNVDLQLDEYNIVFETLSVDRRAYIYLVADNVDPIISVEEIGKNDNGHIQNLIMTLAIFTIPAGCTSLEDLAINVWHYEDVEFSVQQQIAEEMGVQASNEGGLLF